MIYKKPAKLKSGDKVAIVSPSWGGPSVFPDVYENGIKVLKEWGLEIVEYPTARMDASFLRENPQVRAGDAAAAVFLGDDSPRDPGPDQPLFEGSGVDQDRLGRAKRPAGRTGVFRGGPPLEDRGAHAADRRP